MRRRPESGVTFIELLIAVAIIVTVLALVVPIFVGASRTASVQTGVDVADRNAARRHAGLRSNLRSARVTDVASLSSMPAITYRIPGGEEDVDEDGEILWSTPRTLTFDVVQTLDEGAQNVDLNGDGDHGDRFLRCRLMETIEGEPVRAISGASFVLDADAPQGDVDGDGEADIPFTVSAGGLRIVLWSLIRPDVTGLRRNEIKWYREHAGDQARPTNPTCDETEGEDLNGNGIPDLYEYRTGYDGESERFEAQTPIEMPYLGKLEVYEALAARKGGSLIVDGVRDGTLVIEGTDEQPLVMDGPIVVRGDVVIKGKITGQGTIYAGRNVHVAGNVSYVNPPGWTKPTTDPGADAATNESADLVGYAARGSIIFGDYTVSTWKSSITPYIKPPFTQSYVVPATDEDIGYVTGSEGGEPTFDGNYTAADGGTKQDGSERHFYESSLSDEEFHDFADTSFTYADGVFDTNHLFSGRVGQTQFNGTIVARDEAILYSTSITVRYDVRIHSNGYESIDIYLPRAPMRRVVLWREGT